MDVFCSPEDAACAADVLGAVLHALQTYCCVGALLYVGCFKSRRRKAGAQPVRWRGHAARGLLSLCAAVLWCACAGAAALRAARAGRAAPLVALAACLASTVAHAGAERRGAAFALLPLAAYWALCAAAAAARVALLLRAGARAAHLQLPLHLALAACAAGIAAIDIAVFYAHISRKKFYHSRSSNKDEPETSYKYNSANIFSKITFFWLTSLLRTGYSRPLELSDLGALPSEEKSINHYNKLKCIYLQQIIDNNQKNIKRQSLWRCYFHMIWPNFYIGGVLKLLGDLMALVPPLGLCVVVQYATDTSTDSALPTTHSLVTVKEFITNGFVMAFIILVASIAQGILSQNSTHLVYVEGIRLKTALQGLIFDKCLSLASWSHAAPDAEQEPLISQVPVLDQETELEADTAQAGTITNLVTHDTYNIMSLIWIGHYIWAIPFKISIILYLLYTKLGVSAIIGAGLAIVLITPLQFLIGKKMSDNAKEISNQSDHRISKISEILHGMKTIKLGVWEDLFKEKILNLREVELNYLNKESFYWGALTFTTHASTIVMTVVTFCVYLTLESQNLSAVNAFASLALINQLTVPLLVLPVTVYTIIQATVSTKRIEDLLRLPDSSNARNEVTEAQTQRERKLQDKLNTAFVDNPPTDCVLDRISEEDQVSDKEADDSDPLPLVRLRGAAFAWNEDGGSPFVLEVNELDIEPGKLIMIVGPTGSGKSSLLSAILGEMNLLKGEVLWRGQCTTAYAGQTPWMVNAPIRENIVLCGGGARAGPDYCPRRYARVLRAVGLLPDLQLLPDGDLTRLGALGVSLSGGQRARVCVARALYSRARLLALDEPLGALDPALARHVLTRGLLAAARRGRTVLLATNRWDLLHYADVVVVMEGGRIRACGAAASVTSPESEPAAGAETEQQGSATARERSRLLRALHRASLRAPADDEPPRVTRRERRLYGSLCLAELPAEEWGGGGARTGSWARRTQPRAAPRPLRRQLSSPPATSHPPLRATGSAAGAGGAVRRAASADSASSAALRRLLRAHTRRWTPRQLRRLFTNESTASADLTDNETEGNQCENKPEATPMSESEPLKAHPGQPPDSDSADFTHGVPGAVWWQYARASGRWSAAYCAAALAAQALAVLADCRLASLTARPPPDQEMSGWVRGYVWTCALGAVCAAAAQGCAQAGGARARRRLHDRLLHAVLHLPLRFFDRIPIGRTLNRFSADVLVLDKKVCGALQRWSQFLLLCAAAALVTAAATPWCLAAAPPLAALYRLVQQIYTRNARSLQQTEAETATPVVTALTEARAGAAVVRAGALQPRMRRQLLRALDNNHHALLTLDSTNRWLGLTLDVVGACVVCLSLTTALACSRAAPSSVAPALVGLVGSYTMLLPAYLAWVGKFRAELDMYMGAIERILHYIHLPVEDYRENADFCVGAEWGARGEVVLEAASVRHAPDCPPVLSDVSIHVRPGDRVTICGRSGGGKSSLLLACAGAAELCAGLLRVDGADAARVPLRALRRRASVLPQDAALFAGTLRENLDPLGVHTDAELWRALRAVRLDECVAAQAAGLECAVRCGGAGWSAGQRARACCARALLCATHAGALLLDEPGAALDARADRALVAAVASAAPHCTLITVSHRVPSADECSHVVVVEGGTVAEQGPPAALLADRNSLLARMLAASRT